jgi:hypothetical protein
MNQQTTGVEMQQCYIVTERVDEDTHSPVHVFLDKPTAEFAVNQLKLKSIRAYSMSKLVARFDRIGYEFNKQGIGAALEILGRHIPALLNHNFPIETQEQQTKLAMLLAAALQLCIDQQVREVGDLLGITRSYYVQSAPITLESGAAHVHM